MPWTANRSGSSRAPGACTSPRVGAGSLPYLARELGTDCGLIAPEMCAMPTAGYPPADQQASAYDGGGVR
jgi:hypothetical protein